MKNKINVKYIGILETKIFDFKSVDQLYLKVMLSKFLKRYNLTTFQYINKYIQKLQLCGFCNKQFAFYDYIIQVIDNQLIIKNVILHHNIRKCRNKQCKHLTAKINPNSFEFYSKAYNVSLQKAKQMQKEHNRSSFYKRQNQTQEEYKKRQSRSKQFYINKYGQQDGLNRWKLYCQKISNANKKETLVKKYGQAYADKVSQQKKNTLENFIKRYGQNTGKERYFQYIRKTTNISRYLHYNKIISSKEALVLFKRIENDLILLNICSKDDIQYADGQRQEYQFKYIEDTKCRWINFDFYLKKYNIDIEYNGSAWHYNLQNENLNDKHTLKSKQELKLYELHRQQILEKNNFKVFKIWDYEIKQYNIDETLTKLYKNIQEYINEKFK